MQFRLSQFIAPALTDLAPATREFYRDRGAGRGPRDPAELRAARAAAAVPAPADPPPVVETVGAGNRRVPVRIHLPSTPPAAVLMEIHGGGFYLGSAARSDVDNRKLADELGIAVVGVDYRLAPEAPWPAAPDDCETVARWLAATAPARFGTSRLFVGGFSAGSTLAVTTLLRLRAKGIDAFDAAVLQFGTYDLSAQTPHGRLIADEYFIEAYTGSAPDRTHPDISPLYADPTGMPPLLMVVGADDILLRDNLAMAAQLAAADVDVDLRVYPDAPHGFTAHPTPMAQAARRDIRDWLAGQLADR